MANLVELFDNIVQMQNLNGVPLAAGKLYVYALGRTRLMDSWSDVDGESLNPNPIILDDAGQAHVYVSDDFDYTLVVCDQYNNEIFSLDKYLYSKGSHSHADVAVAPSESIAVSSYHVGECTVYVPYLTGQLGKVYEGIDPIVVNNQVDKISANHVPLGVQDPLYFVQDDEEGCIIGCSAQTEIPAELSGKWDNASDVVIANSAQWSEGTTYEAGSYIDINNNTISVTGLSPLPADTASTGLVAQVSADITAMIPDTSDMATQTWVNEQGFLTAHQDISNKLDTTAFSTVSGDFLTAIPDNYATKNYVSDSITGKLDSTAFSTVSGDFLTAHQSLDGLMSADLLEVSDNKITGYNGTAFAGQGGGVTGDYELSAGSGISIEDFPLEQKTVISVTAQGGNPEVEQAVIDNSATWDSVTAKADITAIPSTAGLATEDWVTAQGYLTTAYTPDFAYHDSAISAIDESAIYDTSAHARINTLAGRINTLSSDKADVTALADYQTTVGMTAYLTTGDSAEFMTIAERSDYIPTGVSSEFYTTANTANYISEVPDTYLQNTDLSTEDGKVTAISGIPLSAGGDVPEGVMVESGLEYNAVQEISGYNGSAIAQYGAEKQWLVHDDTLVHAANSAQYALGVNLSAVAQLLGVDETVLFESANAVTNAPLSESMTAFNRVRVSLANDFTDTGLYQTVIDLDVEHGSHVWEPVGGLGIANMWVGVNMLSANTDYTVLTAPKAKLINFGNWTAQGTAIVGSTTGANVNVILKVVGIGRKEV